MGSHTPEPRPGGAGVGVRAEAQPIAKGAHMSRSHVFGTVLITMFVVGVGLAFGQGDGYIGIYSDAAGRCAPILGQV